MYPSQLKSFLEVGGTGSLILRCKRYNDFFFFFINWDPEKRKIKKVGQFPSVADFHLSDVKNYKSVITSEKLKEFTKAIGLAANGVGIGSFVYLRRIFESLIEDAKTKALDNRDIDEKIFKMLRMDEKIQQLSKYLPAFLVENKSMYSILSVGIHQLDEPTCLEHFDTLRIGIELILDEKLETLNKRKKIEEIKKKISDTNKKFKK